MFVLNSLTKIGSVLRAASVIRLDFGVTWRHRSRDRL